jgi:hypothetical protein
MIANLEFKRMENKRKNRRKVFRKYIASNCFHFHHPWSVKTRKEIKNEDSMGLRKTDIQHRREAKVIARKIKLKTRMILYTRL